MQSAQDLLLQELLKEIGPVVDFSNGFDAIDECDIASYDEIIYILEGNKCTFPIITLQPAFKPIKLGSTSPSIDLSSPENFAIDTHKAESQPPHCNISTKGSTPIIQIFTAGTNPPLLPSRAVYTVVEVEEPLSEDDEGCEDTAVRTRYLTVEEAVSGDAGEDIYIIPEGSPDEAWEIVSISEGS